MKTMNKIKLGVKYYVGPVRNRKCGCEIFRDEIGFCNMHFSAPGLLKASKAIQQGMKTIRKTSAYLEVRLEDMMKLQDAIDKAEGK